MEGCLVVPKAQPLITDENTLKEKLTIQLDIDICHKLELGDVTGRKMIEKYNAYNLFQENTKLKPLTEYWKSLCNLNKTSSGAGHRSGADKSVVALRKISSKARKEISLENISTKILKLRDYIIKDEEKQFNITSFLGYMQCLSLSLSGLHLSLLMKALSDSIINLHQY